MENLTPQEHAKLQPGVIETMKVINPFIKYQLYSQFGVIKGR